MTAAIDPPSTFRSSCARTAPQFTTLVPPAYEYSMGHDQAVEASYVLTAEVAFSNEYGDVRAGDHRRRPDAADLSRTPSPGALDVIDAGPMQVAFSEPIVLRVARGDVHAVEPTAHRPDGHRPRL